VSLAAWFLVHLLVGAIGAWLARNYARQRQMFDLPDERRSHSVPTPRGGGVAIAASLLLASGWLAGQLPGMRPLLAGFGTGLVLVSLVGWIDDHRPLSAWLRLAAHLLAGLAFAIGTWVQAGDPLATVVAFVAPVVLVNAWNFMDGIDGLAATQAILVAVLAAALAGVPLMALGLALVASTAGFLPWNFPRARLFLGDVGSGAIGFAMGALVAMAVIRGGAMALALVLFPLSAFLLDTGLTLARRILRRERWWQPHVTHAFQHAARRHGHVNVTLGYAAWTALAAAGAWLMRDMAFTSLIISLLPWYAVGAFAWWRIQQRGATPALEDME